MISQISIVHLNNMIKNKFFIPMQDVLLFQGDFLSENTINLLLFKISSPLAFCFHIK